MNIVYIRLFFFSSSFRSIESARWPQSRDVPRAQKRIDRFLRCPAQKRENKRLGGYIWRGKDWTGIFDEVRSSGSRCARKRKSSTYWERRRRRGSPCPYGSGQQQGRLDMFISQAFVIPRNKDREWNQWIVFDIVSSPHSQRSHLHSKDASFFIYSQRRWLTTVLIAPCFWDHWLD